MRLDPATDLAEVLPMMAQAGRCALVMEGAELTGLLTTDNLSGISCSCGDSEWSRPFDYASVCAPGFELASASDFANGIRSSFKPKFG